MRAQARIIDSDGLKRNWYEKCLCGAYIDIDEKNPEFARCYHCLRIYTPRKFGNSTRWAICSDPYLGKGLTGAFMKLICVFPYNICPNG